MSRKELRAPEEKVVRIEAPTLKRFVAACFEKLEVPAEDAETAAEVLVQADLLGVDSHGVSNYIQLIYVPGLRGGQINPRPQIETIHETPVSALVEGDGGLGLVVGTRAMELAVAKARESGVGLVAVRNSRHYGMAGYYSFLAVPHDMIGLSMTNSERLVVPTFGKEARVGTNPLSVAVPANREAPFLLDMATSTVPLGKVLLARRVGVELPLGWAADGEGQPTTDPEVAFQALRLLPLGGTYEQGSHKGYGLGAMVDILAGVLSGAGAGLELSLTGGVGHFFGAIRIDAFRPVDEFKAAMDDYLELLRRTPPADGEERVYYAGLIEHETQEERRRRGIPLHERVVEYLNGLAEELGVDQRLTIGPRPEGRR